MKKRYDAVVIGSGFGGAVSACRLAEAGLDVAVIERGRRYPAGSFPRDTTNLDSGWLWERGQGLFDVRPFNDVLIVQAAGYGGGSLVYANVQYRPPPELFNQGWPEGFSRAELDPYYDLVGYMLDVSPVEANQPNGLPPKTVLLEKAAADLDRSAQFFRPNLAVNFDDPARPRLNKFGVEQRGCVHCGECDIGCNIQAKNTLDLNYLAVAEQHGATVVSECEAGHIATGADGYIVHFRNHASGKDGLLTAPDVFVCAGAINSTELLLRSRDQYGELPNLSDRLGSGYSGNGDFLAFAFDTSPAPYLPSRGPTITTAMVYDDKSRTDRTWFVFEDGGYPQTAAAVLQLLNEDSGLARTDLTWDGPGHAGHHATDLARRLATDSDHAAVFLVMGRDRANGTISFLPCQDRICVHWDIPSNLPLYVQESAFCNDVAGALGGRYSASPAWTYLRQPVSVHNLGGCPMGESPADGVVDPDGEVFGYPGLHVLDGAILPSATGANPSHTIAAVAERCIESAIRRITREKEWSALERGDAHPFRLPEDEITIPRGGTAPPRTPIAGMRFTETMRGTLVPTPQAPGAKAVPKRRRGSASASISVPSDAADGSATLTSTSLAASFRVTISSPDLAMLLADPAHPAAADGTVWLEGYTGPDGQPVVGGMFNLLTDADGLYRRNMLYMLPFHGRSGRHYIVEGHKDVWDHGHFDVWGSTTTLYTSLIDADDPARPAIASGVLKLNLPMFARQMTTMRITGTDDLIGQLGALSAFGQFFAGNLFDVFVRARLDP